MKINRKTIVLLLAGAVVLGACSHDGGKVDQLNKSNKFQTEEQAQTGKNQERLNEVQPAPQLAKSAERANLIKRLNRINDPDRLSYIALLGEGGEIITTYTVKGKVSSVNSLLTNPEQVQCLNVGGQPDPCVTTSSPDLDGSYGTNGDAVFFFTTEGALVQWNGAYVWQDRPFTLTQPPVLIQQNG